MSCYTCNRKAPYRAEIRYKTKEKEKMAETASITAEALQVQIDRLINVMDSITEYQNPEIEVKIFHNEELVITQDRSLIA